MRFKDILIYAAIAASILMVLKSLEFSLIFGDLSIQLWLALAAILFIVLGIFLSKRFLLSQTERRNLELKKLKAEGAGLSKREIEVLELLIVGMSNQEIADQLYLSVPTIKTHLSNIYEKLDVKRRTQAVQRALDLGLIESPT